MNKETEIEKIESVDIKSNTNPSESQVKELEKKHGKLTKVKVQDKDNEEESQYFYFKQPSLSILRLAQKELVKSRDTVAYGEIIIKNCIVNGVEAVLADEEIMIALLPLADEFTTTKIATIEKN
jgi:hypothetical protein